MSIAEDKVALYQEQQGQVTSPEQVDQYLNELAAAKGRVPQLSIAQRIDLAQACLDGMMNHVQEWFEAACRAKGIALDDPAAAEELGNGPLSTARYLRLIMQSLADVETYGVPQLPGKISEGPNGQLRVQVVPTKGIYDSIAFSGFKAHVWQEPGVMRDNLSQNMARYYREGCVDEGISLILGAGNVSSIPPLDAFTKFFQEGKVVLLKMNPVNEYLGPIFAKAFKPLIDGGYLRIIYGGAEIGSHALQHELVDEAHITGSVLSHHTIVWGPPGPERERRKQENDPLLKKEITSELGNVSPWIIVPGNYTEKQLRFQAENLASTIVNNASFNCVATKVIITSKSWPDRQKFLGYLREILNEVAPRKAYYPGAQERFARFAGAGPLGSEPGTLPWTLKSDIDCGGETLYFTEESFVCVTAETALDADSPEDFMVKATEFANNRLTGTLGCTVMIHPDEQQQHAATFDQMITDLRYGTVAINYWSALSYAMITPPWGGFPGGTLHDPQSGIGWVHNTYMFDRPQKTVLEGPLTAFPKPLWFPTTKCGAEVTWKVINLYKKPSMLKLPGLLMSALKG